MNENRKILVLFDIGGVLVELDFGRFYREAARISEQTPEEFQKTYLPLEIASLTGKVNERQYLQELQRLLRREMPEEELKELEALKYPGQIGEVVALKRKAYEKGYAVGLFSNVGEIGIDIFSRKHPEVLETFDAPFPAVYSCKLGFVKPSPEMYTQIKGFGRVVLVDDKVSYLKTGEQFGWYGIWFTPFIDRAEAIRAVHADETYASPDLRRADSVEELTDALNYFGIKIF